MKLSDDDSWWFCFKLPKISLNLWENTETISSGRFDDILQKTIQYASFLGKRRDCVSFVNMAQQFWKNTNMMKYLEWCRDNLAQFVKTLTSEDSIASTVFYTADYGPTEGKQKEQIDVSEGPWWRYCPSSLKQSLDFSILESTDGQISSNWPRFLSYTVFPQRHSWEPTLRSGAATSSV